MNALRSRSCVNVVLLLAVLTKGAPVHAQSPSARLSALAEQFVQQQLTYDPAIAYFTGLTTTDNSRFPDRSPVALAALDEQEREDLAQLNSIDAAHLPAASQATYANLKERLESDLQLRVCKSELWNVNHFDGWQSEFAEVAARQPIASAADRRQALQRWSSFPRYIDTEIANLKLGLAQGYSAPQSVVSRVIKQMDGFTNSNPKSSPFYSPASRSSDPTFQAAFLKIVTGQINPALHRYRDFLQSTYLPKARTGIAISDLPNGPACYEALLRQNTTLTRTPQQVFDLGQKSVAANLASAQALGARDYGTTDIPTILAAINRKPAEHFQSRDDLLTFSRSFLKRTTDKTATDLIDHMPSQTVVIEPLPAFEESAGVGSRFEQEPDPAKPAKYLIQLSAWSTELRAQAEIVTVHETVPGHHLQHAVARQLQPPDDFSKLVDNSAYTEGWARYAELMAEEDHIYDLDDAAIVRKLWPARGMVVDPGLHAFHWTRQQAIDFILAAGNETPEAANDLVDRIAVMPGQLTSYDSGGLEIRALRDEAQAKLGSHFDLRRFNHAVLEEGIVPLNELHAHIEQWIEHSLAAEAAQ